MTFDWGVGPRMRSLISCPCAEFVASAGGSPPVASHAPTAIETIAAT
jgi:hypothetical protein